MIYNSNTNEKSENTKEETDKAMNNYECNKLFPSKYFTFSGRSIYKRGYGMSECNNKTKNTNNSVNDTKFYEIIT